MTNHELARFLLINADATKQQGVGLKLALIYFLFRYSDRYSKDHYNHFAFDVLEYTLAACFSSKTEIENVENTSQDTIKMGYALIHFINQNFFESDDMEEILLHIDQVVIEEAEQLLKQNITQQADGNSHILIRYLLDRMSYFDETQVFYQTSKYYVLNIGTKLLESICTNNNVVKFKCLLKKMSTKEDLFTIRKKWEKGFSNKYPEHKIETLKFDVESLFLDIHDNTRFLSLFVENKNFSECNFDSFFQHVKLKAKQNMDSFDTIDFEQIESIFGRLLLLGNILLYETDVSKLFKDSYLEALMIDLNTP